MTVQVAQNIIYFRRTKITWIFLIPSFTSIRISWLHHFQFILVLILIRMIYNLLPTCRRRIIIYKLIFPDKQLILFVSIISTRNEGGEIVSIITVLSDLAINV